MSLHFGSSIAGVTGKGVNAMLGKLKVSFARNSIEHQEPSYLLEASIQRYHHSSLQYFA